MSRPLAWTPPADWERRALLGAGGIAIAVAWVILVVGPAGEGHGAAGGARVAAVAAMWVTMMVAMMLPSAMPWFLAFARSGGHDAPNDRRLRTLAFVGGYFALWLVFALCGAIVQVMLVRRGLLGGEQVRLASRAGGLLLIAAGTFQFTPLKRACLRRCRSPIGFFLSNWRSGVAGAFRMGARHGVFCLGCCWALMSLAFVLGVMSALWMAVLTLVICAEKLTAAGERFSRGVGLALLLWGAWWLVGV